MLTAHRSLLASALLAAVTLVTGCDSKPKRYPVSGTVHFKNAPLPDGSITFIPDGGDGQMGGAPIKDGKFEMPKETGLLAGKYKVSISRPDPKGAKAEDMPGSSNDAKELIPAKYNAQTELSAEVKPEGPNQFPFELK